MTSFRFRFNCQTARASELQTRVIASVLCPARDKPVALLLIPRGACGTMDGSPRPRRHVLSNAARGSVHPEISARPCVPSRVTRSSRAEQPAGSAEDAANRLRSARGWTLSACCMSPGIAPFVGTPPGSNGLPSGHALGPSARRAGVCRPCPAAPGRSIRNPRSSRPGIVAATRIQPCAMKNGHDAPLAGLDGRELTPRCFLGQ